VKTLDFSPEPQPGFPQQEVSYIKALGKTTGNLWTRPGGKDKKEEGGEAVVAAWNSAISTAGMPGGRGTRRWTVRGAVGPFRPFSVERETALSTRMLPVRKKRKNPEESRKSETLDKNPLLTYVAIRRQRRFQR
jgi:hypothetical protein